ncbi:hypothetical protein AYL99_04045 [Fonsecaea erecta]|uniref:Nephrocystin 3-like N-terminal domain-containing protein n=1 Tax=Fonsecaea erecta TaxID=1367422 RepID=A0A178ZQB9_9EURO|nr:hypothetical protein AYL99_04045 [Fonsecaea erecta]OAP61842.1 hypothetical protein AYL99_04045 [Fonsecaea erecta]
MELLHERYRLELALKDLLILRRESSFIVQSPNFRPFWGRLYQEWRQKSSVTTPRRPGRAPNPWRRGGFGFQTYQSTGRVIYQHALTLQLQNCKLVFITHDVGGTLVKEALVLASQNPEKYATIFLHTTAIVFLGCPHRSDGSYELRRDLIKILKLGDIGTICESDAWSVTHGLADWVEEVNSTFAESRLSIWATMFSVYSSHSEPALQVFDEYTATTALPFEVRLAADLSHQDLASACETYEILVPLARALRTCGEDRNYILALASQAPPQYPLEGSCRNLGRYEQITTQKNFQDWKDLGGIQLLLLQLDSTDVAIHAAECLFHYMDDNKASNGTRATCLYFEFISSDSRRNSIESMLYACLAQTISRFDDIEVEGAGYKRMFRALEKFIWLNREDLLAMFVEILLDLGAKEEGVVLVLDNLQDNITSCDWFLTKVNKLAEECEVMFKVLITSQKGAQPEQAALWARASLDGEASLQPEHQDSRKGMGRTESGIAPGKSIEGTCKFTSTDNLDLDFLRLVQSTPMTERDCDQLFYLLQACKGDKELRSMVINWHRTGDSVSHLVTPALQVAQSTSISPPVVFKLLLSSLPLATDRFLHDVLNLLLYSLRPLSVLELNDLVQCDEKQTESPVLFETPTFGFHPRIQTTLGGLIKVHHNEVQFAHADLRRYLLSDESPLTAPAWKSHQEIADFCLEYISARGRDAVTDKWPRRWSTIAVEWRHTFLDYAVKWWPSHARLSQAGEPYCTTQLLDFLGDGPVVDWAKMHWELQNPFTRGSITKENPWAIIGSYGLSEAMRQIINDPRPSMTLDSRVYHECIEATVGNSELEEVVGLINVPIGPSECLDDIILAAIRSDNQKVAMELVTVALRDCNEVRDPALILCRASSLGQTAIVQALLPLAIERGLKNATVLGMTALQHACSRGNLETAKVLVAYDDMTFKFEHKGKALELACRFGHAEIIDLLTAAATFPPELASLFDACVKLAIKFGQHRVLDHLLTAFKSVELEVGVLESWMIAIINAKHRKCWNVLWKHVKDLVDPNDNWHFEVLRTAMRLAFSPAYSDLFKAEGTLAGGGFATFLEFGLEQDCDLLAIEALVAAGGENCPAEEYSWALEDGVHLAVRENREDVVGLLIRAGAPLDKTDSRGRTPLFLAVYNQRSGIARILIEAGAGLEEPDDDDWRPIHAAYDNVMITRLLIQKGADINAKTHSGWTCLYYAAKWDKEEVLEALLEQRQKINPDAIQDALSAAVSRLNTRCVGRLLDAGADPRDLPSQGCEELMSAVNGSAKDIVKMLLEFNLDLEKAKDVYGYSVLNRAVLLTRREDDDSIVKAFVNRGADLESASNDGYTALCSAAWQDNLEIARYLILKGARINITGGPHGGPLIRACRMASLDMVKLLCKYGADTNIVHPGVNATPLQAALLRDPSPEKNSIISYLLDEAEYTADANLTSNWWGGPLNVAVLSGTMEVVRLLLKKGARVDGVDKVGRMAIHYALYRSIDRVELLCQLEHGAQLFEPDKMGRGALHLAVVSGRLDLVQYVLQKAEERGLDVVNDRDRDHWTPLLWAMRLCPLWEAQSHQRQAILEELLSRGADLFAEGLGLDQKWTALKLANHYGLPHSIINFLEARAAKLNRAWDSLSRRAQKAKLCAEGYYCDACFITVVGVYYRCDQCGGFFLCFKCYRSREIIHPRHLFTDRGEEYDYDSTDSDSYRGLSEEEQPGEKHKLIFKVV